MAVPRAKRTRAERDLMMVKHQVYPNMMTLMLLAVCDVMHPSNEQLTDIMDATNRYASHINEGLVDLEDARNYFEKITGRTINNVLYGTK